VTARRRRRRPLLVVRRCARVGGGDGRKARAVAAAADGGDRCPTVAARRRSLSGSASVFGGARRRAERDVPRARARHRFTKRRAHDPRRPRRPTGRSRRVVVTLTLSTASSGSSRTARPAPHRRAGNRAGNAGDRRLGRRHTPGRRPAQLGPRAQAVPVTDRAASHRQHPGRGRARARPVPCGGVSLRRRAARDHRRGHRPPSSRLDEHELSHGRDADGADAAVATGTCLSTRPELRRRRRRVVGVVRVALVRCCC